MPIFSPKRWRQFTGKASEKVVIEHQPLYSLSFDPSGWLNARHHFCQRMQIPAGARSSG
jgi:hypothetical protein